MQTNTVSTLRSRALAGALAASWLALTGCATEGPDDDPGDSDAPADSLEQVGTLPSLATLHHIYILGDSLSDQHNQFNSAIPGCPSQGRGYWNGRFTNGYNWVDYLTQDNPSIAAKIDNRAVGGAKVLGDQIARPSLATQAQGVLNSLPAATRQSELQQSLVIMWIGANDIRDTTKASANPGSGATFGRRVADSYLATINQLQAAGARHFVLVGTPYFTDVPDSAGWNPQQRLFATDAMSYLSATLALRARNSGSIYVDVPTNVADLVHHRKVNLNLQNVTTACFSQGACSLIPGERYRDQRCAGNMFFDTVHPTTGAHCGIAKWMERAIAAQYSVAGGGEDIFHCAERAQTPTRPIRYFAQTDHINSASTAGFHCQLACLREGGVWTTAWSNVDLFPNGVRTNVGSCECRPH